MIKATRLPSLTTTLLISVASVVPSWAETLNAISLLREGKAAGKTDVARKTSLSMRALHNQARSSLRSSRAKASKRAASPPSRATLWCGIAAPKPTMRNISSKQQSFRRAMSMHAGNRARRDGESSFLKAEKWISTSSQTVKFLSSSWRPGARPWSPNPRTHCPSARRRS